MAHPSSADPDKERAARLTGHLDRGWERLDRGDPSGAEKSARMALEVAPDDAEALTLLGATLGAAGRDGEAIECLDRALEAEPEYATPALYAAELLYATESDLAQAFAYAERASEHAEEEAEFVDAVVLCAEIRLAQDEREKAHELLAGLPPVEWPEPSAHVRAALALRARDDPDPARAHVDFALGIAESVTDDVARAGKADALHTLGLVHEAKSEAADMVKAWLGCRKLDLAEAPLPWSVSTKDFEAIAEDALAELPERIRELLANVPILIADYPAMEVVADGNDPRMLGFFAGVPYPEKSHLDGAQAAPDSVFLYQRNIERQSRNRDEVAHEIRITLLHETGHFFGLSDEELDEMGLG